MFLFDGDYFCERMSEPGGLARYLAEFLVQFYNGVTIGAVIIALLLMLVQRLTWRLMFSASHYALSFIPVTMLWYAMGDENVMLTYVVALAMALAAVWGLGSLFRSWGYDMPATLRKLQVVLVLMPLLYWFIGPLALLPALFLMPLAYMLMAIPVVIFVIGNFVRLFPKASQKVEMAEAVVMMLLMGGLVDLGFEKKKYELIEYDYLVRIGDWNSIIAKAEKQMPDLPMSVSATNLALGMTDQLGERAFDFYQHGTEGLLPKFERNFATAQLSGEIYFHLGLINTAQRFAFEAMEAIPNYNKSARVVKRLAETNLINGQYKVAEKYLRLLEKTVFYRPWAQRTIQMLGNEKAINEHPLYGALRQYRLQDDLLFSERELDKICGQLFIHNHQNQMATQYLLMIPLLDRDIPRFMNYAQYVQSKMPYNPRSCQEGIAFAFMQRQQQPPQGLVNQLIRQQMIDFARVYSKDKNSPELARFRNTVWYYLVK